MCMKVPLLKQCGGIQSQWIHHRFLSQEQRWEFSMVLSGTETLFPYWKGGGAEWGYTVREQTALLTTAGVH